MATSPLFGWQEPDDTSLVKDGAAAIRTLGNAIDTSMGDLLGGTTGQVLAKASNTNMDFTWVAQDDSNAIQNAIVDAKGDLIAATANDTPARLAVGSNGETLVADSTTSTGLRYTAGTFQSNPVLNSAMQIWQRGTSFSLAASTSYLNGYVADRWQTTTNANQASTISRQATNDTTNLPFIQYALRHQRNNGQTGTGEYALLQNFEKLNAVPFAGKTITFSFYARAGANYSATSSALNARLWTGTGTDGNVYGGFAGQTNLINTAATLTTTWQRFTFTATLASNTSELAIGWTWSPTGTAGAADYVEITGVQLDIGSVALPFRTYAGTVQGELAACQRYYYRNTPGTAYATQATGILINTTSNAYCSIQLPVQMRTIPSSVDFSTLAVFDANSGSYAITAAALTAGIGGTLLAGVEFTASGMTVGRTAIVRNSVSATAYLGFSAEL